MSVEHKLFGAGIGSWLVTAMAAGFLSGHFVQALAWFAAIASFLFGVLCFCVLTDTP